MSFSQPVSFPSFVFGLNNLYFTKPHETIVRKNEREGKGKQANRTNG